MNKIEFIKYELFILAWGASVQHNKIYSTENKENRKEFKKNIFEFLNDSIIPQYKDKKVDENTHCKNIINLREYVKKKYENKIIKEYPIGTAQKLLNLILKYYWCIGIITEPPHFPIDRIILNELNIKKINWTEIKSIGKYKEIISTAKEKVNNDSKTLAVWELENYERPL